MPRPGPFRPQVSIRLRPDAIALLDRWAAEDAPESGKPNRSDVVRDLLRDAIARRSAAEQRKGRATPNVDKSPPGVIE